MVTFTVTVRLALFDPAVLLAVSVVVNDPAEA
jgi:hypothetical protein